MDNKQVDQQYDKMITGYKAASDDLRDSFTQLDEQHIKSLALQERLKAATEQYKRISKQS